MHRHQRNVKPRASMQSTDFEGAAYICFVIASLLDLLPYLPYVPYTYTALHC